MAVEGTDLEVTKGVLQSTRLWVFSGGWCFVRDANTEERGDAGRDAYTGRRIYHVGSHNGQGVDGG